MKKNTKLLLTKIAFFIASLSLTSCVAHATRNIKPPTENFIKVFTILKLSMCDKNTKKCTSSVFRSTGSGLIVYLTQDRTTAITAGHVCDPPKSQITQKLSGLKDIEYELSVGIQILNHKNNMYDSQVIISENTNDSDRSSDLCLIEILNYKEKVKKITFAKKGPAVGEEVYYMGAPGGVYHPPVVPIFKGLFSGEIDHKTSMATLSAAGGSSGGAVMSTDNNVYGVLFATHYNLPSISLITNFTRTKKFIDEGRKILLKHKDTSIQFQPSDILHKPYMP